MRTIIQGPPLDIETKSVFVAEKTMTRDKKGTSYDGEELINIMEPIFEDMNKNIMKGFECLAIQIWKKYIDFNKNQGQKCIILLEGAKGGDP